MAQLCHRKDWLSKQGVAVAIISFGAPWMARAWLAETGAPFRLLVDESRDTYRDYGLERSVLGSWRLTTLWYYARNWGRRPDWDSEGEDVNQLGGDFLLDSNGILRMTHRSTEPIDRPDPADFYAPAGATWPG